MISKIIPSDARGTFFGVQGAVAQVDDLLRRHWSGIAEDLRDELPFAGAAGAARPELVVCCVDATNLSRNLYFVLQAQELGLNLLVALTMSDEAGEAAISAEALAALLDCPVVTVIARTGQGVDKLKLAMASALKSPAPPPRSAGRVPAAIAWQFRTG